MEVEKTISPNYFAAPSEQPVVLAVDDWPVLRKTGHESRYVIWAMNTLWIL
jgi:hypothetical protein